MSPSDTSGQVGFACPVCSGSSARPAYRRSTATTDLGRSDLRPSASSFGTTLSAVVRCTTCGHGSLAVTPTSDELGRTYEHVTDSDDADEDESRVATATRDLHRIADRIPGTRGRLLDVGCWTGALVHAATELGWRAEGIEPSAWAVEQAQARGLDVRAAVIGPGDRLEPGAFQVVTCCDVLEHLVNPAATVARIHELLEPDGVLFATVPDSGSVVARALGSRWWSVLPMHVQYFTRSSLERLLVSNGFDVLAMTTHSKVFTRRYYADRLASFLPIAGPAIARVIGRSRGADRPVAPDFADRVAVIARRRPNPGPA